MTKKKKNSTGNLNIPLRPIITMEENRIIKDLRVLTEEFIPSRIIHRDGQLKALRDNLKPAIDGHKPRNSFLNGTPGTGKTCISQYAVEELKKHASVMSAYVNCWEYPSRFKILYSILQSMGETLSIHRKGTPTDELLDILKNKVQGKCAVVILDEADQLDSFEVLYDLILAGVSMILIANNETVFHSADPRIRSRLSSLESIQFPSYSQRDLQEILEDRAHWGLIPGAIHKNQLGDISSRAEGDARAAINILRIVSEEAENNDLEKIPDKFIEKAFPKAQKIPEEVLLKKLTEEQKLILDIVRSEKKLASGSLLKEFQKLLEKQSLSKTTDRTFRNHLEKLVRYGFIESEGEGRWRTYSRT